MATRSLINRRKQLEMDEVEPVGVKDGELRAVVATGEA